MTLFTITALIQAVFLVMASALALQRYQSSITSDPWERLLVALTPIAVFLLICLVLKDVLEAPFGPWNAARLSPSFAIRNGYDLYYPATRGPVLDTLYGPVVAWSYLPATLAHTPTIAMMLAECISMLLFFLPIFLLLKSTGTKKNVGLNPVLFAFLIFCFLTYQSYGLHFSAILIHADAPALGFGMLALVFLIYDLKQPTYGSLGASAVLVVLSAWAKQTMAPLCVALPLYLFLTRGFRPALRYGIALGISFLIVTGFILYHFKSQALIFNLIILPSRHHWVVPSDNTLAISRLGALVWGFKDLLQGTYWLWVLFGLFSYWNNRQLHPRGSNAREWFVQSPGGLFFLVSLFLAPGAILGRIKEGGGENNFSLSVYFLLAAIVMELSAALNRSFSQQKSGEASSILQTTTVLLGLFLLYFAPTLTRLPIDAQRLFHNPQQVAYEFLKHHPDEVYFPNDPLPALLAEGKLYHYCEGIHDRERGGFSLSDEHFFSAVPTKMKWIALSPGFTGIKYFPAYHTPIELPDLPLWVVFGKS